MYFMQLDDLLDLVNYEQRELHRQAARDALAAQAARRAGEAPRAPWAGFPRNTWLARLQRWARVHRDAWLARLHGQGSAHSGA
jgi:hypothetical protein